MIKLITDKKHRFNREILIKDKSVFVDSNGEINVNEDLVTYALEAGFELVDKNVKFTSKEEELKIKEVNDILEGAKSSAKEIIEEARREAERIILEAKKAANVIIEDSGVIEKEEFKKKLMGRKIEELKEIIASTDMYTKEQYNTMKKTEMIDAIMKIQFGE